MSSFMTLCNVDFIVVLQYGIDCFRLETLGQKFTFIPSSDYRHGCGLVCGGVREMCYDIAINFELQRKQQNNHCVMK